MEEPEFKNKTILAVGAHPDDNDFGCGGTMAKAADQGARIIYLVATNGQRGGNDPVLTGEKLATIRRTEQHQAAGLLGVTDVSFLDYMDGELTANLELKEKIVRAIRRYQPEMVFTIDPSFFYYMESGMVNHSDHRAIGEATLDACYPLARDLLSFPDHADEGLAPCKVRQLFLHSLTLEKANCVIDVSAYLHKKLEAIAMHRSQVGTDDRFASFITEKAVQAGEKAGCRFSEAFVRLQLPE